jgi:hypothetical protein
MCDLHLILYMFLYVYVVVCVISILAHSELTQQFNRRCAKIKRVSNFLVMGDVRSWAHLVLVL